MGRLAIFAACVLAVATLGAAAGGWSDGFRSEFVGRMTVALEHNGVPDSDADELAACVVGGFEAAVPDEPAMRRALAGQQRVPVDADKLLRDCACKLHDRFCIY